MHCRECQGDDFAWREVEVSTLVGGHIVVDRSMGRPVCRNCGAFFASADLLEKVQRRAVLIAFTKAPRVTGAMLRFARKALDMTQAELAKRLGTTFESVSRWEREERPMERWVPLAVLGLVRERLMPPLSDVEFRSAG